MCSVDLRVMSPFLCLLPCKCVPWSDAMLLRILFPKPRTVILAEAV